MEIRQPLCITSRLLPGVEIGEATISIEYAHVSPTGQQGYRWFIDSGNGHRQDFQGDDLYSGAGGGSLQKGLASLLGFLAAFAEECRYNRMYERETYRADQFPPGLAEWATDNVYEITVLNYELEERPGEFIVE